MLFSYKIDYRMPFKHDYFLVKECDCFSFISLFFIPILSFSIFLIFLNLSYNNMPLQSTMSSCKLFIIGFIIAFILLPHLSPTPTPTSTTPPNDCFLRKNGRLLTVFSKDIPQYSIFGKFSPVAIVVYLIGCLVYNSLLTVFPGWWEPKSFSGKLFESFIKVVQYLVPAILLATGSIWMIGFGLVGCVSGLVL